MEIVWFGLLGLGWVWGGGGEVGELVWNCLGWVCLGFGIWFGLFGVWNLVWFVWGLVWVLFICFVSGCCFRNLTPLNMFIIICG